MIFVYLLKALRIKQTGILDQNKYEVENEESIIFCKNKFRYYFSGNIKHIFKKLIYIGYYNNKVNKKHGK